MTDARPMRRRIKRARVSSRQWHALHVVHEWEARCPSRATMQALVTKGLIAEGPPRHPPQYHLTALGVVSYSGVLLDSYLGKPVDDQIYPAKAEVTNAIEHEIDRRHDDEQRQRRFPNFGPWRREYTTVQLDAGVCIRVPVDDVFWDMPDAELNPTPAMEKQIHPGTTKSEQGHGI